MLLVLSSIESRDLEDHARWMAEVREEGVWVMW